MGGKASTQRSRCLDPGSKFERWTGIPGMRFHPTCELNAFILNALYSGLVTWIVATASANLNDVIAEQEHGNTAGKRAAVWAATFAVSFGTSFSMYLLLKGVFGAGGGMTSMKPLDRETLDALEAVRGKIKAIKALKTPK
jgi:hypothetical protein